MENSIVFAIVGIATAYAVWVLSPRSIKAALANRLLSASPPPWLRTRLEALLQSKKSCGCDGCDVGQSNKVATGKVQVIHFPSVTKKRST